MMYEEWCQKWKTFIWIFNEADCTSFPFNFHEYSTEYKGNIHWSNKCYANSVGQKWEVSFEFIIVSIHNDNLFYTVLIRKHASFALKSDLSVFLDFRVRVQLLQN